MVGEVKRIAVEDVARQKSNGSKTNEDKKSKKSKTDLIKNDFNMLMMPKNDMILWTCPGPVKILHRFRVRFNVV
jgi:hypothetical protein